jgi:hypothetical protein
MGKITGNTSSEKLNLLLDGELHPSEEAGLFSELSLNDELRSEMRDLLSIRNTVRSDTEAFVPPLAVTTSLFQKAGYALPGAFFTGLKTLLIKYSWVPLLVAAISSFATYSFLRNGHDEEIAALEKQQSALREQLLASQAQNSKLLSENENLRIAANKPPEVREVIKYIKIPAVVSKQNDLADGRGGRSEASAENIDYEDNDTFTPLFFSDINDNSMNGTAKLNERNVYLHPDGNGIVENSYSPMTERIRIKQKQNYITVRGMSGLAYPRVDVDTPEEFSNFALGFFFLSPYEDVYIGMEGGREPFSQQFYNVDPDGKKYLYEQRPNVWWGGAGLTGEFGPKIDALIGARPYGKLFLGASELGPLGKMTAGLSWRSTTWGLGAFLGVEGSLMGYQNQGAWYTSGKLGLTYGMSIKF